MLPIKVVDVVGARPRRGPPHPRCQLLPAAPPHPRISAQIITRAESSPSRQPPDGRHVQLVVAAPAATARQPTVCVHIRILRQPYAVVASAKVTDCARSATPRLPHLTMLLLLLLLVVVV